MEDQDRTKNPEVESWLPPGNEESTELYQMGKNFDPRKKKK